MSVICSSEVEGLALGLELEVCQTQISYSLDFGTWRGLSNFPEGDIGAGDGMQDEPGQPECVG